MTKRDEQIHEAFERQQSEEFSIPYEEMKARFDHSEGLFGHRYIPGSMRQVNFLKFKVQWLEKELETCRNATHAPKDTTVGMATGINRAGV